MSDVDLVKAIISIRDALWVIAGFMLVLIFFCGRSRRKP